MTLSPTEIHECLDRRGLLDDAHGPGVYALEVDTPDAADAVARAWHRHNDVAIQNGGAYARLSAPNVCYVGASKDVYARLADHARGEVRKATFLEVFAPVDLVDVWPTAGDPFETAERARARELSRGKWVVWCNGELL